MRILVQDEFTPGTLTASKQGKQERLPVESKIESGSGLPCMTTVQSPLKAHDATIAAMAAKVPIAPAMRLSGSERRFVHDRYASTRFACPSMVVLD